MDKEAYVIPTVGIFFLGCTFVAVIFFPVLMFVGGKLPALSSLATMLAGAFTLGGGGLAVILWISHLRTVHTQRRVIVDERGVTYCHNNTRQDFLSWDEISEVRADEEEDCEPILDLIGRAGRKIKISGYNFNGYHIIRSIISDRLPGRITQKR